MYEKDFKQLMAGLSGWNGNRMVNGAEALIAAMPGKRVFAVKLDGTVLWQSLISKRGWYVRPYQRVQSY